MVEYFVSYVLELWIFCNGGIFCRLVSLLIMYQIGMEYLNGKA